VSTHILEVTPDGEGFSVECLVGNGCSGWLECGEPHTVGNADASDGPFDCDEDAPWYDEDEWEFHGIIHTWHYGFGWTVPYPGCVVAGSAVDPPDDLWQTVGGEHRLNPGRWLVDDDWDESECYLSLLGPAEPSERGEQQ
jgi:hypothetical protein